MTPNEKTLSIYSVICAEYQQQTAELDAADGRDVLMRRLSPGAHILDAGCGWGRDTRTFLEAGFQVTAFDGCAEMARAASAFTGVPVQTLRFQEVSFAPVFDGVWARASLLHLEPDELRCALAALLAALKPSGWLYACFKEGDGERVDAKGRYFCNMTEARFRAMLDSLAGSASGALPDSMLEVALPPASHVLHECYVTPDQFGRPERWINFLVQRAAA